MGFEQQGPQGVNINRNVNHRFIVTNANGDKLQGIDVDITVGPGTPFTLTTDENGAVLFFVENSGQNINININDVCYRPLDFNVTSVNANQYKSSELALAVLQPSEVDCFNPDPVNNYNFYRWHEVGGVALPLLNDIESCFCLLNTEDCFAEANVIPSFFPDQYRAMNGRLFKVQAISKRRAAFYINFETPTAYADFNDLSLAIIDGKNLVIDNIATLNQDFLDDAINYNIWAEYNWPVLDNGTYFMVLLRNNSEVVLVSQPIEYISDLMKSGEVRFRDSFNTYDYQYKNVPDFFTIARVPLTIVSTDYQTDEEIYTEVSTRRRSAYKAELDRVYTVESYYFDQNAHEAMATALMHDEFYINNIRLQRSGAYTQETTRGNNKSKGTFQAYDRNFSTANQEC